MRRVITWIARLLIYMAVTVAAIHIYKKWHKKFKKDSLLSTVHHHVLDSFSKTLFPVSCSDSALLLLTQPYIYFAKGKQAVAYSSLDSQYVLKIIKWPKKKKKQEALALSITIATTLLHEQQTGLIATIYGPKAQHSYTLPHIVALDSRKKVTSLSLDTSLFVIQKKALFPLKETLFFHKWKEELEKGKQMLQALFQLLRECREKEVIDLDGALIRNGNIAFTLDPITDVYKAIYIDLGKFATAPKNIITEYDLKKLKPLHSWLASAWPDLVPFLLEEQQKYIDI